MIAPVKLSAAERIINAFYSVTRRRGEHFSVTQQNEAAAIRPIVEDVRREGECSCAGKNHGASFAAG